MHQRPTLGQRRGAAVRGSSSTQFRLGPEGYVEGASGEVEEEGALCGVWAWWCEVPVATVREARLGVGRTESRPEPEAPDLDVGEFLGLSCSGGILQAESQD